MRFILVSVVLLFFFLSFTPTTKANTIRVEPAYIDVELKEASPQATFDFFIVNNNKNSISVELSTIDFRQTEPYGTVSFLGKEIESYSYALSSFLSFETNNIELSPNEKRKVLVTVKNRQDLSPGGHYAAIVVRQRPPIGQKEKTLISPAISSLVYLVKSGGERYNLSFKEADFPKLPIVFSYPGTSSILLQNDGNIHLIPYGRVDITDMFGRLLYKGIINENSVRIFPQSRRFIPVYSRKKAISLPISLNKISIEGRDSLNKTKFSYQEYFLYVNPFFILVLALVPIPFVFRRMKHRKIKSSKK